MVRRSQELRINFSKTYEDSIPSDVSAKPVNPRSIAGQDEYHHRRDNRSLHFHETKEWRRPCTCARPARRRRRKFIRASVRGERACTNEVSSSTYRDGRRCGRKHTITALGSVRARQLHQMLAVSPIHDDRDGPISKGASTLIIGVATSPFFADESCRGRGKLARFYDWIAIGYP